MGKKVKKQNNSVIYEIFMSGLPYECNQDDIEKFLQSPDGIVDIKLPKYQDSGKCRGYAHVKFNDKDAYENALKKNKNYIKSRYVTIQPARGEKQVPKIPQIPVGCKTMFVKGLPYQMTEQQIKKQFGSCGLVSDIRMVRNWSNKNFKGFAYIQYKEANHLKKAINKYHNTNLQGRRLICDAQTNTAKKGYKKRNPNDTTNKSEIQLQGAQQKQQ